MKFITEMQEQIDYVWPIIQEHMHATQEEQRRPYHRPTQTCEFHPGVLLLVPDVSCKLLAHWKGPYTIEE